jgi:hypothetical protein
MAIKSRTAKQATSNERRATHEVVVYAPGCGTSLDMDFFHAAGFYSDASGCGIGGNRDHSWCVIGEAKAEAMAERLRAAAKAADKLNGRKLGITVKVRPYERF